MIMKQLMRNILEKQKTWYLFLWMAIITLLIVFVSQEFFITENLIRKSLSNNMSGDQLDMAVNMQQKISWLTYIFAPIGLALKFFLVAGILALGAYIWGYKSSYKSILKVVILAESIVLLGSIIHLIVLSFGEIHSLQQIQSGQILSLNMLVNQKSISDKLYNAFSMINIFEIIYWYLLATGLSVILNKPLGRSFLIVASSYLICFALLVYAISCISIPGF